MRVSKHFLLFSRKTLYPAVSRSFFCKNLNLRGDVQHRMSTDNVILTLSFEPPPPLLLTSPVARKKLILLTSTPGTVLTKIYFLMISSGQYLKCYDFRLSPLNNIAYKQRRNDVMMAQCGSEWWINCLLTWHVSVFLHFLFVSFVQPCAKWSKSKLIRCSLVYDKTCFNFVKILHCFN